MESQTHMNKVNVMWFSNFSVEYTKLCVSLFAVIITNFNLGVALFINSGLGMSTNSWLHKTS